MRDQDTLRKDIKSAQRLVSEIWALKLAASTSLEYPAKVILNQDQHQLLQLYYAFLGDLEKPGADYIGRHQIFGLDYCVDFDGSESNLPRLE